MPLKPPFGWQPEQLEQSEHLCFSQESFFSVTRRIIPACSKKSIFRKTSSGLEFSSAAIISTERECPSFNRASNSSIILENCKSYAESDARKKQGDDCVVKRDDCRPLCGMGFLVSRGQGNDAWHVECYRENKGERFRL